MAQKPVFVLHENGKFAVCGPILARKELPRFFRWDDDLESLEKKWRKDPHLRKAFQRFKGLRLIRQEPWNCLAGFILSIYSNIPKIETTLQRLSRHYGKTTLFQGASLYALPSPREIAETGESKLRAFGMGFRAKFLKACAKEVVDGFSLEALRDLPYSEAKKSLMSLFGPGEKVADCVLLFSLEHRGAFPVDVWMKRIVEKFYFDGRSKTEKYLSEWGRERFGENAGYAQQYLYTYGRWLIDPRSPFRTA